MCAAISSCFIIPEPIPRPFFAVSAMATSAPPPAILIYGNQDYSVEEAATAFTDAVLGDGPRDFSFQRFDAAELIRPAGGEAGQDPFAAFQMACEAAPFLCDRWVVRLDRVEAIRPGDRAANTLRRALESLVLFPVSFAGEPAWATEDDLLPTDPREGRAEPQRLVAAVESRTDGGPVLELTPQAETQRFLLSHGGARRLVDGRAFLRDKLKGRFSFSDQDHEVAVPTRGSAVAHLHTYLERVLANLQPGLHLVLTASANREGDLSRSLLTLLKKSGRIDKFVTYDDYHPVDWVMKEARGRGAALTRPLAELLIHLAGNDLGTLARELEKLALVFGGQNPPGEEAFVRAVSAGAGGALFLISDRLGNKDLPGALKVLEHFLADNPGAHPLLISIVARHVRQLLHLHDLMGLQVPEPDWAAQLKLHPFLTRRLAGQARRFRTGELEGILAALAGLDRRLKLHAHLTGPLLREFLHAVCRDDFRRPAPSMPTLLPSLA